LDDVFHDIEGLKINNTSKVGEKQGEFNAKLEFVGRELEFVL